MNDESYQRALCKVEEYKRLNPQSCCCIPVPGPQGPATITVGTTTTGEPGTDASVTNSGTPENVVLDFVIPQGEAGPQGETGAAGPQGEAGVDGQTPTLAIGTVTTGQPGAPAEATITGTAPNYILNLTLPLADTTTT